MQEDVKAFAMHSARLMSSKVRKEEVMGLRHDTLSLVVGPVAVCVACQDLNVLVRPLDGNQRLLIRR